MNSSENIVSFLKAEILAFGKQLCTWLMLTTTTYFCVDIYFWFKLLKPNLPCINGKKNLLEGDKECLKILYIFMHMKTEYKEICHFLLASKNSFVLWNKLQWLKKHLNNTKLAKAGKFKQISSFYTKSKARAW